MLSEMRSLQAGLTLSHHDLRYVVCPVPCLQDKTLRVNILSQAQDYMPLTHPKFCIQTTWSNVLVPKRNATIPLLNLVT